MNMIDHPVYKRALAGLPPLNPRPKGIQTKCNPSRPVKELPVVRPNRCKFLGDRLDNDPKCNGRLAKHECELDQPAVPALFCQTGCKRYIEDEHNKNWLS